jgi:hypothetical protein
MDVEVYYAGQRSGTIPYMSVPAFRLFCKQNGFQLRWDAEQKRIELDSGLKGRVCVLAVGKAGKDASYECEILNRVQAFLSEYGAEVVIGEPAKILKKDVAIRFSVKEIRASFSPKLIVFRSENESRRTLVDCLHHELKQTGINCVVKLLREARSASSGIAVQFQLPQGTDEQQRKAYAECIAFFLASGILHYFLTGLRISPLSYLSRHLLKAFGGRAAAEEADSADAAKNAGEETDAYSAAGVNEQQEAAPTEPLETEAALGAQTIDVQPDPDTAEARTDEAEPQVTVQEAVPLAETFRQAEARRLEAEVFFDYTVLRSDVENRPFLLIGNICVKNTGTEALYNPVVCLRADPPDSIKMGGQILPPNLVETLAVQSSAGIKGWRYLENDWFTQAKERGEYWMAPIHPVRIEPNTTEMFQNFQFSVTKPETGNTVTVEGYVFFQEQGLQFAANNRIALSL